MKSTPHTPRTGTSQPVPVQCHIQDTRRNEIKVIMEEKKKKKERIKRIYISLNHPKYNMKSEKKQKTYQSAFGKSPCF